MTSGNTTPLDQDQKSASGLLAIFIFASFTLAQIGAAFIHPGLKLFDNDGFLICDGIALAGTIVFGIINLANNFSTNDPWKSWLGWGVVLYNIGMTALFISAGA